MLTPKDLNKIELIQRIDKSRITCLFVAHVEGIKIHENKTHVFTLIEIHCLEQVHTFHSECSASIKVGIDVLHHHKWCLRFLRSLACSWHKFTQEIAKEDAVFELVLPIIDLDSHLGLNPGTNI